jgi:DNA-binding HxlR family transcriptional regulator
MQDASEYDSARSMPRSKRSYEQYCPGARALDIVGQRWTLLIVRELMAFPRRYTDLLRGLPGIGPNVLADRLREMEAFGLVDRRTLPPPGVATVYELTEVGRGLIPVVEALRGWGTNFLGPPKDSDRVRIHWLVGAMLGAFRSGLALGVHDTYEFRIEGVVLQIRVDDGTVGFELGSPVRPDLVFSSDKHTLASVISRQLSPSEAVRGGKAKMEGDRDVAKRWLEIMGIPDALVAPG